MSSNSPQQPSNKIAAVLHLLSRVKDPNTDPNDRANAWEAINRYLFSGTPPAVWQNFPLITRGDSIFTKIDFLQEVLDYEAEKNASTPVDDEDYSGWDTYTFDGKAVESADFKREIKNYNYKNLTWSDKEPATMLRRQYVTASLNKVLQEWVERRKVMDTIYSEWMSTREDV
ncbi:uncharacterized protein H6S33_011442 [Morchella sextelata]|uniref:uncharacterized protein n=1 Tax=Morchella sextelata TaxID=1174677 RepID=UPI001D05BE71|nr:uncharacterized protein H6S33_011442 [Morchella sextelata]KAH0611015.1 hypothetical protein H6S33_011442 [Morchella sextelata]